MGIINLILLHSSYVNLSTSEILSVQLIKQHLFPLGTDKNCVFFLILSLSLCNFQMLSMSIFYTFYGEPCTSFPSSFQFFPPFLTRWWFGQVWGNLFGKNRDASKQENKKVVYQLKVMLFLSEKRNSNELLVLNTQNISYTKHVTWQTQEQPW